jgi:hypothetical protein
MPAPEKVEWGSGPVRFELYSDQTDVLREAESVFGRWRPDPEARLAGTWNVTRCDGELIVDPPQKTGQGSDQSTASDFRHAITMIEYMAIARIAEECDHVLTFHGALLIKDDRSIALVGPKLAGKSTLATALWQKGWKLEADDMTMMIGRTAVAAPRRVSLRGGSREHLDDNLWSLAPETTGYIETNAGFLFHPMDVDDSHPRKTELSAVFFLNRNGGGSKPARLREVDAAFALFPYTNLSRIRTFPEAFPVVAKLMSEVPAFDLPRAPIAAMIATVESLTATV